MPDPVAPQVVAERYARLIELQEEISLEGNRALIGAAVEVMTAAGEGRKDARTGRLSGRARDGRLVHFSVPGRGGQRPPRPGDLVTVGVTWAAPHYLVADEGPINVEPTRGGDAWDAASGATAALDSCGTCGTHAGEARPVLLGMPTLTR